MMPHPRPRGGRWLLALAAGCAWLLAGQHLVGQAGADQAGRPQAATVAPPSTFVQHGPAAPPRAASAQRRPALPPSLNTILHAILNAAAALTGTLNGSLNAARTGGGAGGRVRCPFSL